MLYKFSPLLVFSTLAFVNAMQENNWSPVLAETEGYQGTIIGGVCVPPYIVGGQTLIATCTLSGYGTIVL